MVEWCKRVTRSPKFEAFILTVIVVNAAVVGAETSPTLVAKFGGALHIINNVMLAIFVFEIAARMVSYAPRPLRFFADGWNVFDFVIVVASMLPAAGAFATVARLARVLRIVRLVTVSHDLRLIVATMLKSIPSMGHVILLLTLLIYIYAVLGVMKFGQHDPQNWGDLGKACLSLFQILTLEGWVEMQNALREKGVWWVWIYFGSYIVVAVFVVINLFIAVVTNNLQQVKTEQASTAEQMQLEILQSLKELRTKLERFENRKL